MKLPGEVKIKKPDEVSVRRLLELRPYVRQSGDCIRSRWHISERKLFDYLLVCIIKGEGVFSVGVAEPFTVRDGDVVWIPPDCPHEMSGLSPSMHLAYIHFDLVYRYPESHWDAHLPGGFYDIESFKEKLHPPISDSLLSKLCGKIEGKNNQAVIHQARRICAVHKIEGNDAVIELSGMMMELLGAIIKGLKKEKGYGIYSGILADIHRKICEEADLLTPLAKFAKDAGMSESHFRRVFKNEFGINPVSLKKKYIMRKAHDMMFYEGMNVSEVSERLGFSSVSNFSRAFKSYYGISPKNMKKFQP